MLVDCEYLLCDLSHCVYVWVQSLELNVKSNVCILVRRALALCGRVRLVFWSQGGDRLDGGLTVETSRLFHLKEASRLEIFTP